MLKRFSTDAPNAANESAQAPDVSTAQQTQMMPKAKLVENELPDDSVLHGNWSAHRYRWRRAKSQHLKEVRKLGGKFLPASQLAVEAEEGAVTVTGTVPTKEQLTKIDTLAK